MSDKAMRGEDKEETSSSDAGERRGFLKVLGIGGLGACAAGMSVGPALIAFGYPLSHETTSGGDKFIVAGKLSRFKPGEPVRVDLIGDKTDGWNRMTNVKIGTVFVVNEGGSLKAYSAVCPHLGCLVDYEAEEAKFLCACHRSYFSKDGKVESGPSPRGMDELEIEVHDDVVSIRYKQFKLGTEKKEPV
jgi:Rieske Fe-S protein